jgi:hypothetical protein
MTTEEMHRKAQLCGQAVELLRANGQVGDEVEDLKRTLWRVAVEICERLDRLALSMGAFGPGGEYPSSPQNAPEAISGPLRDLEAALERRRDSGRSPLLGHPTKPERH